jgi:hypothetical protein
MAYALNRLPNQAKLVSLPDQTTNIHLFTLQPEWVQSVYDYMLKRIMPKIFTFSCKHIWFKKLNHLCYKVEYFANLDKKIGFVISYNQNRCQLYYRNYMVELEDIFL